MYSWNGLVELLTPLPLITVFLAGFLVGLIYIRRIIDLNRLFGYHVAVLGTAFFIVLGSTRWFEGNSREWEEWIASFILFAVYLAGVWIGRYLPLTKLTKWMKGVR